MYMCSEPFFSLFDELPEHLVGLTSGLLGTTDTRLYPSYRIATIRVYGEMVESSVMTVGKCVDDGKELHDIIGAVSEGSLME